MSTYEIAYTILYLACASFVLSTCLAIMNANRRAPTFIDWTISLIATFFGPLTLMIVIGFIAWQHWETYRNLDNQDR